MLYANTTPFFIRELSTADFDIHGGLWNQSPGDTEGRLYSKNFANLYGEIGNSKTIPEDFNISLCITDKI